MIYNIPLRAKDYAVSYSLPLVFVGLHIDYHLPQTESSLMRVEAFLKLWVWFRIGLLLCPFSKIIVVDSSLWPMTCLAIGSQPNNNARYGFYFVSGS